MAITASLLFASKYHLRYMLDYDGAAGATVSIPNAGGATPDLATDSATVAAQFKALLQTVTATNWAAQVLLFANPAIRITITPSIGSGISGGIGANTWRLSGTAAANRAILAAGVDATAAAHALIVDIEFIHTYDR